MVHVLGKNHAESRIMILCYAASVKQGRRFVFNMGLVLKPLSHQSTNGSVVSTKQSHERVGFTVLPMLLDASASVMTNRNLNP